MARERRSEARFDFRGGLNVAMSPDLLDVTELARMDNWRVSEGGYLQRRKGNRWLHDTVLGEDVRGVFVWDSPGAGGDSEVLAVTGGAVPTLSTKPWGGAEFAAQGALTGAAVDLPNSPAFAEWSEGARRVFIVAGPTHAWDGTTLSAVGDAPAGATSAAIYNRRLFLAVGAQLHYSKLGDPTDFSSVGPDGAGVINLATTGGGGITGLAVAGGSLLVCTPRTIRRFTGVDVTDIHFDNENVGLSEEIGARARRTVVEIEGGAVFGLGDMGAWVATEAGVRLVSQKVQPLLDARALFLQLAHAAVHRGRGEVWLFLPTPGNVQVGAALVYNYRLDCWSGPFTFPADPDITCSAAARALTPDPDTGPTLVTGSAGGRVRRQDTGAEDNAIRDGTLGDQIASALTFPPFLFGAPLARKRVVGSLGVRARLAEDKLVATIGAGAEDPATDVVDVFAAAPQADAPLTTYRIRTKVKGRAPTLMLATPTGGFRHEIVEVHGVVAQAALGSEH